MIKHPTADKRGYPVNDISIKRRKLIQLGAALPIAVPASLLMNKAMAGTTRLEPTAACDTPPVSTRAQTAGPFFTPNTPLKRSFRGDAAGGEPLDLIGFVKTPDCRPVANAVIELWHADAQGRYDNQGYSMRGHQFTDAMGRFIFETIVPGRYPGRTLHYHIIIAPPGARTLTTQLYFPNDHDNDKDWIFDARLLLDISQNAGVEIGRFDFVVETS
ncbi:MAG: intradiol ring-cleavage dioxygenase [Gammaproteobacteria bacterium]|nr:intradiol ring-cleavage dioxygenase [Gammaproteobacteria bacterium]